MTITLKVKLTDDILRTVLYYYNTHCPPDQELKLTKEPFHVGFVVSTTKTNKEIRQVGNMLTNVFNIKGFDVEDEILLYQSLCYALGNKYVNYYPSLSSALENSPTVQLALQEPTKC
jgi:hypothetical protein